MNPDSTAANSIVLQGTTPDTGGCRPAPCKTVAKRAAPCVLRQVPHDGDNGCPEQLSSATTSAGELNRPGIHSPHGFTCLLAANAPIRAGCWRWLNSHHVMAHLLPQTRQSVVAVESTNEAAPAEGRSRWQPRGQSSSAFTSSQLSQTPPPLPDHSDASPPIPDQVG